MPLSPKNLSVAIGWGSRCRYVEKVVGWAKKGMEICDCDVWNQHLWRDFILCDKLSAQIIRLACANISCVMGDLTVLEFWGMGCEIIWMPSEREFLPAAGDSRFIYSMYWLDTYVKIMLISITYYKHVRFHYNIKKIKIGVTSQNSILLFWTSQNSMIYHELLPILITSLKVAVFHLCEIIIQYHGPWCR